MLRVSYGFAQVVCGLLWLFKDEISVIKMISGLNVFIRLLTSFKIKMRVQWEKISRQQSTTKRTHVYKIFFSVVRAKRLTFTLHYFYIDFAFWRWRILSWSLLLYKWNMHLWWTKWFKYCKDCRGTESRENCMNMNFLLRRLLHGQHEALMHELKWEISMDFKKVMWFDPEMFDELLKRLTRSRRRGTRTLD